jgi:predicted heme/steroid binding protein
VRALILHDGVRVGPLGLSTVVYALAGGDSIFGEPPCPVCAPTYTEQSTNINQKGPLHLTPAQLALYNGTDPSLPIYLAVNGSVFDVSANPMMYGPGGSYHFFAGRDATRAFVSGCFQDDLTPDLAGVEEIFVPVDDEEELRALSPGQRKIRREKDVRLARANVRKVVGHWENFFRSHKRYFQVGEVARDADADGERNGKRELCEAARLARPKREKT